MTKKILFGMMAATMIFATSCENEMDLGINTGDKAQVTFSVGTPEIATRAYSDGKTATLLEYAVYAVGEDNALTKLNLDGEKTFSISTNVELQLTTGNKYAVIFWAAAEDAPYAVDFTTQTMTVNYENAVSNDEKRDAFYAYHEFTVSGAQTETVYLKRPFAQLNIGTNDYAASTTAGYTPKYSYVKVPVSKVLNLVDGSVDTAADVEFKLAAIPTAEDGEFPVEGYEYLSMNYLLVSADKEAVDLTFGYSENETTVEKTRKVGSVPVQRNYRTNIYGQLLTSDVDINVEIVPEYVEPAYEANLQYAAENGGEVTLTSDVVLDKSLKVKAGKTMVIDLNGYTISGADGNTSGNYYLIDNRGTLTIKDNSSAKTGAITLTAATDREWNASSVVVANNPGGKLVIEGGRIEHMGGTAMAYAIDNLTNGKGTYAETVINGGSIKSSYRAVRQFLNGVEAQNILTVNGGVIEGANKSIWMQDPSKNANSGKLIVEGGELKGDVYLYVTAGSTEWPVEVSIKAECVKNEVLTGNVPEGYIVALVNGYHIVAYADVVVENADALAEALAKGENVLLTNDITTTSLVYVSGGILDGNGYTVTPAYSGSDCGIMVKEGTVKNLTVKDSFRALGTGNSGSYVMTGDVYYKNITTEGSTYGFNISSGNGYKIYVEDCTIGDWNSYAGLSGAEFTNCTFLATGKAKGMQRVYGGVTFTFTNCTFPVDDLYDEKGYRIEGKDAKARFVFVNCKLSDGTQLTKENFKTYFSGSNCSYSVQND